MLRLVPAAGGRLTLGVESHLQVECFEKSMHDEFHDNRTSVSSSGYKIEAEACSVIFPFAVLRL